MTTAYFSNDLTPGVLYFRCERLRASLSTGTCSSMWVTANQAQPGARVAELQDAPAREPCRNCPIGAAHAGCADASTSPLCGVPICARCHNDSQRREGAIRLIGGMVCVSCKNREYEWLHGRNSKGTKPVKLACLSRRRIRYMSGAEPVDLTLALSLNVDELVVAALRDSRKRVRFGLACGTTRMRQLRLW